MNIKIITYTLLFSFLLTVSGCYTTQNYSDTPEKILSGKSDIDLKGEYVLDSLSLHSKLTIKLRNYLIEFTEKQKEKYLVYYYPKNLFIDSALMVETNSKVPLYKKPVADTLNFKAIDSMYFTGKKADVSYIILGTVIGIPVALMFYGLVIFKGIDPKH